MSTPPEKISTLLKKSQPLPKKSQPLSKISQPHLKFLKLPPKISQLPWKNLKSSRKILNSSWKISQPPKICLEVPLLSHIPFHFIYFSFHLFSSLLKNILKISGGGGKDWTSWTLLLKYVLVYRYGPILTWYCVALAYLRARKELNITLDFCTCR